MVSYMGKFIYNFKDRSGPVFKVVDEFGKDIYLISFSLSFQFVDIISFILNKLHFRSLVKICKQFNSSKIRLVIFSSDSCSFVFKFALTGSLIDVFLQKEMANMQNLFTFPVHNYFLAAIHNYFSSIPLSLFKSFTIIHLTFILEQVYNTVFSSTLNCKFYSTKGSVGEYLLKPSNSPSILNQFFPVIYLPIIPFLCTSILILFRNK